MNILIADKLSDYVAQELVKNGHLCTTKPDLNADTLPSAIEDHDILIVRSTKVLSNTIEAASNLKLIVRAGAGTNTIDKVCASENDIKVCNVPGANSIAVAELAMGLIISIDRNIPNNVLDLRNGVWAKKFYSKAKGIYGRNLGILGLGSIGLALAKRASAFGMNVFGIEKKDRGIESIKLIKEAGIDLLESREALLNKCDVISIHLHSTEETKNMINKEFLNHMRESSILINTSRGELVDEDALINAMNEKGILCGLDVYNNEPGASDTEFESELAKHSNVYGTHHIGASTQQAQDAVAEGVVEVVNSFANGMVINCVNK